MTFELPYLFPIKDLVQGDVTLVVGNEEMLRVKPKPALTDLNIIDLRINPCDDFNLLSSHYTDSPDVRFIHLEDLSMLLVKSNSNGQLLQSNSISIHLSLFLVFKPIHPILYSEELVVIKVDEVCELNLTLGHISLSACLVSHIPGFNDSFLID
jgi:hypothetical protein